MTIEHAMDDDGKRIDDQSSRWMFLFGKIFSVLLSVRMRDRIERRKRRRRTQIRFANHNRYFPLRLRLSSFYTHPSKFNPYLYPGKRLLVFYSSSHRKKT